MIKKLILKTIFSKVKGYHYVILQQLDYFTLIKWIERYENKLSSYVKVVKNPKTMTIIIQHPEGVLTFYGYSADAGIIKSPCVYIDRDLPNPSNYKQF